MKNNVKIPFELLKELYDNTTDEMRGKIEAHEPRVITKFKNGDWIKSKHSAIVCITDVDKGFGYGLDYAKNWCYDGDDVWSFKLFGNDWALASERDVADALRDEAKRRGFTYGINFKALDDKLNGSIMGNEPEKAKVGSRKFPYEEGVLYCSGYGKWAMFKDGVWARPYDESDVSNEIELLNERLEVLKSSLEELKSKLN